MNLILLLGVIHIHTVLGENWDFYHVRSVETFQPPTALREDSYFGFSTTYDRYNKRMVISAPRENDIGEVYECNLSKINQKSCSKLITNITRDAPSYTHDYWFGASLKASRSFVMACTPRYTRIPKGFKEAGTYGRCYRRKENDPSFSSPQFPVMISGAPKYVDQELHMDTLGWSLDIGEDNSVIVGGPGLGNKTGIAVIAQANKLLVKRIDVVPKMFNFGYSVAIGYFTNERKVSYAVSSTYGVGQVYFYADYNDKFPMRLNNGVDVMVIGSMYGAVLCAAKMNPHKGNDLLVGAPTYALNSEYNTGAVYAYSYYKRGAPPKYLRTIVGHKAASLFGSAIISVGDLNGDGKDEIAIGAPFEDDGAVYLYSGAAILSNDKTVTWLQKITPSAGKQLKSFGYKLAALQDFDENGCNELAVSAPYEDRVMLYKCLATVTITKLYAHFPNVKNRTLTRQTDFVLQVCLDVKYLDKPKNIIAELSTDFRMYHLYAKLKSPNQGNVYNFKTSLQSKNRTYCENVDFILPLDKDYSMEIEYEIKTKLQNSPMDMDHFTGAHVVLSDRSELSKSDSFWAAECSGAGECISNLSLTITSDFTDTPFITGSRDTGAFHITVVNTGEVAYDPCIQFNVKGGILQVPPMFCNNEKNLEETWKCISMKPIMTNGQWVIKDIIVDLRDLTNQDKDIALNVKLYERCADVNNSRPYIDSIPLKSSSKGVFIKGTTDIGSNISIVEKDLVISKHFEQIYTIMNKGPTNFKNLASTIKLQKTKYITHSDTPVFIHIDGTSKSKDIHRTCKVLTNNDLEMTASCQIDNLFKDNHLRIIISIETNPNYLTYEVLKNQDSVKVKSDLFINFEEDETKSFSLTTLILLREAFVDIWILIAAGLIGLLVIIILAVILYKYGFLQRKNKEKLEVLKRDIRRQTMSQSTMSPESGDRNQILENMEASEEAVPSDVNSDQDKKCEHPAPSEGEHK